MQVSIFIAVETYADREIAAVKYAESDARALAAVLQQHGFAPADRALLINDQATKTSVESVIRSTLKRLTKNDTLLVYYAGNGFSSLDGDGYLACFDTRVADAEYTSLNLQWLLEQLKKASCRRIFVLLDAHHGELFAERSNVPFRSLDHADLHSSFGSNEHSLCLVSCQPDETSHGSSELQHGIWAHHIIEAFDGQSPTALEGHRLTVASLQNYLQNIVPTTLRRTHPNSTQTPCLYGANPRDFVLADLKEVLALRKSAKNPSLGQVKDSILLAESIDSIKSLSGFQKSKGHNVPDRRSGSSQSFISEIANADITADVQRVRGALKTEYKFTRLQLSSEVMDGAATITTPFFNYNVSVEQDTDNPGNIVWRRSVDAITDPDKVLSDKFERVFAGVFDTFELSLHDAVDIEQLIDHIEALGSDAIQVEYEQDRDITSCLVRMKGQLATVKITPKTFSIVYPRAASPKLLIKSFFDIQLELTDTHNVQAIPFEPASI